VELESAGEKDSQAGTEIDIETATATEIDKERTRDHASTRR